MKSNKLITITMILLSSLALAGCQQNAKSASNDKPKVVKTVKKHKAKAKKKDKKPKVLTQLEKYEEIINKGSNITLDENVNMTSFNVSDFGTVRPGLYEVENLLDNDKFATSTFSVSRYQSMTYPEFGGLLTSISNRDQNSDFIRPSKVRVLLLENDKVSFDNIGKASFKAIKNFTFTNKLTEGAWIVGKDVKPGTYNLTSSIPAKKEFSNLGWTISVTNPDIKHERKDEYKMNWYDKDNVITFSEGDLIEVHYDGYNKGAEPNDVSLILNENA